MTNVRESQLSAGFAGKSRNRGTLNRYPLPEQDIDAELGLHDEEVGRGDEAGHQFRVYVGEAVRVLGHVAQQVHAQPRHAALEEENSRVTFKIHNMYTK